MTIGRLIDELALSLPDQEALIYPGRNLRWSFSRLQKEVVRLARGLMAAGIEKGDRVALWATNVPEWIVLQFALAKVGAILVTANTALRRNEVEYLLRQSEAGTLFLISGSRGVNYVQTICEIVPELTRSRPGHLGSERLPFLKRVIYIGGAPQPGMLRYSEIMDLSAGVSMEELERAEEALDPDEVVNIQYTSGTTGFPKGVMLSHRNILNNASDIGDRLGYTSADRLCLTVPLFHCFGCVIGVLGAYTHAASLVPLGVFDPRLALKRVSRERCTAIYGVPTMFIAELDQPEFGQYDLTSLRKGIMAGALCPIELMKRAIDQMHLSELCIAYGLTEASPVVTMTSPQDPLEKRTSTVGRPLPNVEVRIVDPATGNVVSSGEQGELQTRGYHVMKGYYKNDAATREAITCDGWLRTGDLAVMDADGYCAITGRIKDMIIRGGENVYPKEIEEYLRSHPAVSDVAVYGVPSYKYGEEVAAAVKLKPGAQVTPVELQEFCKGSISDFKVPRYIQFVDEFPLTASGKIQKFILRDRAAEDFGLKQNGFTDI